MCFLFIKLLTRPTVRKNNLKHFSPIRCNTISKFCRKYSRVFFLERIRLTIFHNHFSVLSISCCLFFSFICLFILHKIHHRPSSYSALLEPFLPQLWSHLSFSFWEKRFINLIFADIGNIAGGIWRRERINWCPENIGQIRKLTTSRWDQNIG